MEGKHEGVESGQVILTGHAGGGVCECWQEGEAGLQLEEEMRDGMNERIGVGYQSSEGTSGEGGGQDCASSGAGSKSTTMGAAEDGCLESEEGKGRTCGLSY